MLLLAVARASSRRRCPRQVGACSRVCSARSGTVWDGMPYRHFLGARKPYRHFFADKIAYRYAVFSTRNAVWSFWGILFVHKNENAQPQPIQNWLKVLTISIVASGLWILVKRLARVSSWCVIYVIVCISPTKERWPLRLEKRDASTTTSVDVIQGWKLCF